MPTPAEILADQRRVEEATAREMERLLSLAAAETARRLEALPLESAAAAVYRQVEAAIAEAQVRLGFEMNGVLLSGSREAASLGVALAEATLPAGGPFLALPPLLIEQLAVYEASLVRGITDELKNDITATVQLGMLAGKPRDELIREVVGHGLEPVSPFQSAEQRADTVVRTEINRVSNLATYQRGAAAAAGIPGLTKTWRSARDARVRPSHIALNGKTLPFDQKFSVGGHPADHPLDASLPAKEAVHCRCRLTFRAPVEGEGNG